MAAVGEVTLPQFRLLVLLASRGPSSLGVLADELGVHASTFTRLTDRLVRKGLVRRVAGTEDRRSVVLHLDTAGRRIVDHVTKARRRELGSILSAMDAQQRELLRQSLEGFAQAAGEPMDSAWPVW